jgi:opacity protein-like surface antigen
MELNLYQSSETARGSVWQFQKPAFNNYSFSTPVSSTRLIFDIKPGLFTRYYLTHPILGIGKAWNKVSYRESVTGAGVPPKSYNSLGSATQSNFACDLGVGVSLKMAGNLYATLEYIYSNLGNMTPSGTPGTSVALLSHQPGTHPK